MTEERRGSLIHRFYRKRGPRVAFHVLLNIALLLLLITTALTVLEKEKVIDTQPEARSFARPVEEFVVLEEHDGRQMYRFADPYMVACRFPVAKETAAFRIFIAGSSFAMGWPYAVQREPDFQGGDLASWLQVLLTAADETHRFEVINAAAGAQPSSRVRRIVTRLLDLEPDVILAAPPHSYSEADMAYSESVPDHSWVVSRVARQWRQTKEETRPIIEKREPHDRYGRFQQEVAEMVRLAAERGVPLVLLTLPIDLRGAGPDLTDFPYRRYPDLAAGRTLQEAGRYQEAIARYAASDLPAIREQLQAECYESLGQYEQAAAHYRSAIDQWEYSLTKPEYNNFLIQFAAEHQVLLLDLEAVMARLSPTGLPDDRFFHDGNHLTYEGYFLMARAIADYLVEQRLVGRVQPPRPPWPAMDELIAQYGWRDHLAESFRLTFPARPRAGEKLMDR